jgi:hypothetical protein
MFIFGYVSSKGDIEPYNLIITYLADAILDLQLCGAYHLCCSASLTCHAEKTYQHLLKVK